MSNAAADPSFERDRAGLSEWVWKLTADDRPTREAADRAIESMWREQVDETSASGNDRFTRAIRDIVNAPGFDQPQFARRLLSTEIAIWLDYFRRVDESMSQADPCEAARLLKGREPRMAAYLVIRVLGAELMHAREELESMLNHGTLASRATEIIERAGAAGRYFAPRLLGDPTLSPPALASVTKGDPDLTDALIRRFSTAADDQTHYAALQSLTHLDGELCGRNEEVVDLLLGTMPDAYSAIASVGRHLARARKHVIDAAKPRAPDLRTYEGYPQYPYDHAMLSRGGAIEAMRYLADYSHECIPVLIDALDTFEEYDADYGYAGPAERVARVMKTFGPRVPSHAAIALASKLKFEPHDYPTAILDALAAMGTSARDALPLIEAFWLTYNTSLADLETEAVDPVEDPAGAIIQRLRKATP